MMTIFMVLVGFTVFFYNFSYKYFLSNSFFLIVVYLLLNCGGLVDWYFIGYNLGLNLYSYYLVMLVFLMMGVVISIINGDDFMCYFTFVFKINFFFSF